MSAATLPRPSCRGKALDTSPERFGFLRESSELSGDGATLRGRMEEDGYLFLRGALTRGVALAARRIMVERLAERGALDPEAPMMDAVAAPARTSYFMPDLIEGNAPLRDLLYDGPMIALFERLLGGDVRHFDFTWLRAVTPGGATAPHCDTVYMGRGTPNLYTAWTPLGDIPLSMGGLMVLEGSHRRGDLLGDYLRQDVDSYCENGPNAEKVRSGKLNWEHWDGSGEPWDGSITQDPLDLQNRLGGRWLTADYRMGDVLIFTMRTVHASIDNASDRIRLSSDTRYQLASEPIDERWIGEKPIGHGTAGKRGRIC